MLGKGGPWQIDGEVPVAHFFVSSNFLKNDSTQALPITPNSPSALFLPYLHVSILHSKSSTLFLDPVDGKGMSLICHCVNSHQRLTGDSNDREMFFLSQPAHYSGQKEVWATACLLLVDLWMHINTVVHSCLVVHVSNTSTRMLFCCADILISRWKLPSAHYQKKKHNCVLTILRRKFLFFHKDIPLASPQYCSKPPKFK